MNSDNGISGRVLEIAKAHQLKPALYPIRSDQRHVRQIMELWFA
jgi:hypothetical protein